jgi:hypothetical protein
MLYSDESSARVLGFERIIGQVLGKSGSFMLEHKGVFEDGIVKINLEIVPGSDRYQLVGLTGGGFFDVQHPEEYPLTLEFEFEDNE